MTYKSKEFRHLYDDGMDNPESVLYLLYHARKNIWDVSAKIDYGLTWSELLSLFAGYTYGTPAMKRKICDLLEDINFHFEHGGLSADPTKLITAALDCKDYDEYYKKVFPH